MRPTGNHRSHPNVRGGLSRAENFSQALLDLVQHPWQEQVARRVLRSQDVVLTNGVSVYSYPEPEPPEAARDCVSRIASKSSRVSLSSFEMAAFECRPKTSGDEAIGKLRSAAR